MAKMTISWQLAGGAIVTAGYAIIGMGMAYSFFVRSKADSLLALVLISLPSSALVARPEQTQETLEFWEVFALGTTQYFLVGYFSVFALRSAAGMIRVFSRPK